jgi:glycosyltransferase 2 family protein
MNRLVVSRRHGLAVVALATISVGATAVACTRLDLSALRATTLGWVLAALALNSASMVFRAFAWLGALRGALPGAAISAAGVVRATMIGVLDSAIVPGPGSPFERGWSVADCRSATRWRRWSARGSRRRSSTSWRC